MGKAEPGHAYDISGLNVVFALSSIALFVTTVWMIWHDYSREWKGYQREFVSLERETAQRLLEEAQVSVDPIELERLEEQLAVADTALAQNQQGNRRSGNPAGATQGRALPERRRRAGAQVCLRFQEVLLRGRRSCTCRKGSRRRRIRDVGDRFLRRP